MANVTADYISDEQAVAEDLCDKYRAQLNPQQQGKNFSDYVPPTDAELLRAERRAIECAVEAKLRPESDLEDWDQAHSVRTITESSSIRKPPGRPPKTANAAQE